MFSYDSAGRQSSMTDTQGRTVSFAYASSGYLASVTDPTGRQVTYTQDSNGYLTRVVDAAGGISKYRYGANGAMQAINPINGNGGTDTTTTGGDGGGTGGGTGGSVGNNGDTCTSTGGDGGGTGGGTGGTTTSDFGCAGIVVNFGYDGGFNVTSVDDQLGSTAYVYSPAEVGTEAFRRTASTTEGRTTTYASGYAGSVLRTTDGLGRSRSSTYNANADVLTATDAMGVGSTPGNTSVSTYDGRNNLTGSTLPTGAASSFRYDSSALPHARTGATDADGSSATFGYDGPGNLTSAQDTTGGSAGVSVRFTYNPSSGTMTCGGKPGQRCTATDGNNNTTRYGYDSAGNLITVTPPAPLGATRFTYDALGRVASRTDGNNQRQDYGYDRMDRLITVGFADAGSTSTTYDFNGNVLETVDTSSAGTLTASYGYDLRNRETSRTEANGRTSSLTYDSLGNILTATDAAGTVGYGYDAANQLVSLAEPGGSCGSTPVRCTRFGYDNNAQRTSTTYPTGSTATVLSSQLDNSGRVQRIRAATGTVTHSDVAYTYSRTVNGAATDGALVRTRTENPDNSSTRRATTYGYDTLSRLTGAVERDSGGATTESWSYGYDPAGNRTSATIGGVTNSFGYNAANQLVTRNGSGGFSYDGNGNETAARGATTRTAAWNAREQLSTLSTGGSTVPFTYTGSGNGTRLTAADTGFGSTALGVTSQTSPSASSSFVRDPGGTLIALRTGGTSYYYLYDAQGSITGLVNSTGQQVNSYRYDPYGVSRSKTEGVTNPYQYTGGYLDTTTGLYKLGIRYYDPTLGRFTQKDPTGLSAHYVYAGNSPSSFVDTTGAYVSVPSGYSGDFCSSVPDRYQSTLGEVSFQGPCANHDICYSGIGLSRYTCDRRFLADLEENCSSEFASYNPLRYDCYSVAATYWAGVRSFGYWSYDG